MLQSVEMKEKPVDLDDEQYSVILAAGQAAPVFSHHGPPGGEDFEVPDVYDMSADGRTIMVWLSQHMVFFVIGLAGWLCFYVFQPSASGTVPAIAQLRISTSNVLLTVLFLSGGRPFCFLFGCIVLCSTRGQPARGHAQSTKALEPTTLQLYSILTLRYISSALFTPD